MFTPMTKYVLFLLLLSLGIFQISIYCVFLLNVKRFFFKKWRYDYYNVYNNTPLTIHSSQKSLKLFPKNTGT